MQHLCLQISQLYFLSPLLDFFLTMCVWFKCHFSILSFSYIQKGGGCFSILGGNGLHVKTAGSISVTVYIARLTLRYCLAADEREGCNADALFC